MCGTKDAAQCFDVASENAMTAMGYDTAKFSPCVYHSSAVDLAHSTMLSCFVASDTEPSSGPQFDGHPSARPQWDGWGALAFVATESKVER